MAGKLQEYRQIAETAQRQLTGSLERWQSFLSTASRLYKYPYHEQVMIHAQWPDATACAEYVVWNNTMRRDVRRGEQLKNGPTVIGNRTKIKVVKNKVAPPFRTAEFDLLYGEGISREGTILDMAVERDIIHKSGAWFSYKDERIAQGRENTRQYLKDHPEMREEVENAIRATFQAVEVPQDEDPAPEMPESEFADIE